VTNHATLHFSEDVGIDDGTDDVKASQRDDEFLSAVGGYPGATESSDQLLNEGETLAKSSILASAINLSNTILGAGVLAMPYVCAQLGIAFFAVSTSTKKEKHKQNLYQRILRDLSPLFPKVMLIVTACAAHTAIRLLVLAVDKSGLSDQK